MHQPSLEDFLKPPVDPDATFQVGVTNMAELTSEFVGELRESWAAIWTSEGRVIAVAPMDGSAQEGASGVLDALLQTYHDYDVPHRPARIECVDAQLAAGLESLLKGTGVEVSVVAEIPAWSEVIEEVRSRFSEQRRAAPSLLGAGCSEEQIADFAHAAAEFYRARPWDLLDDADLISFHTPRPPRCLRHAVVMGAGGREYGLGFYADEQDWCDMLSQRGDPRDMHLASLTFNSLDSMAIADVKLWQDNNLPLESGEAFPMLLIVERGKPRGPKPKELEFATVVLRALAESSEDEIDTGSWTRQTQLLGRRKKCELTIPNLINPPDTQEWIRRGMMPDRRGHEHIMLAVQEFMREHADSMSMEELNEAINTRFSGPMSDIPPAHDAPGDALCRQAVESFGRRRVVLAKQALAENPEHVEACILLAESTRDPEAAAELFRRAKELARRELGSLFDDARGEFWGLTETRPYMRACQGVADSLHRAGQSNDAIAQYQEMLQLNPNDNQGVRYGLLTLLLAHDRAAEAAALLSEYDEESAQWAYHGALAEYRRSGVSPAAEKALRRAFQANQHVVPLLESTEPPRFPNSYSLGSTEEAAICIQESLELWKEAPGFLDWMFSEYSRLEREQQRVLRERQRREKKRQNAARSRHRKR